MIQNIVVRAKIEQEGRVLLVKRLDDKNLHPGQYEMPGGKVEFGETPEEAIYRECQEEIGIVPTGLKFVQHYSYVVEDKHAVGICFIANPVSSNKIKLDPHEHNEYIWADQKQIHDLDLSPEARIILGEGSKEVIDENNETVKPGKVKLYADGGSRGNPGPSAGGYVLLDTEDNVIKSNGKYLGITTNNQAEYHSLKGGLEMALQMGVREVDVYMDSLLVVNQMKGIFKIRNRDLWPIHDAIKHLLPKFSKVSFTHVPRELNKLADAEVNKTLDAQQD